MAYRSKKVSVPLPLLIAVVVLLLAAIVAVFIMMTRDGEQPKEQPSNISSEGVSSEDTDAEVNANGDIVFYEGVGYDLLSVVNKNYTMSAADGQPELVTLTDEVTNREGGDYKIDARAAQPLEDFLKAARDAGYNAILWSSYRTQEYQNKLYENALTKYMEAHPGSDRAEAVANVTETAPPGTSEHCTGLAVDIYTWAAHSEYGSLDQKFGEEPFGGWLRANAHLYGFILRYPQDKEDITMISYEPWHFRYVGVEAAAEIYERGVTLEEYTGKLGE